MNGNKWQEEGTAGAEAEAGGVADRKPLGPEWRKRGWSVGQGGPGGASGWDREFRC